MATNAHLTHLEDLPLDKGAAGVSELLDHLDNIFSVIKNDSSDDSDSVMTIKFDGAPAFFFGRDPSDRKFFVSKKSILNKEPKVYKSQDDIDTDVTGDLRDKMTVLFEEFSKIGDKIQDHVVYQGDLMFTQNDLTTKTIDGKAYVSFQPNTLVYAFDASLSDAKRIVQSKCGVVIHTKYQVGASLKELDASFISKYEGPLPSTVYLFEQSYNDATGVINLPEDISELVQEELKNIHGMANLLSKETLNAIQEDSKVKSALMGFMNYLVRIDKITPTFDIDTFQEFLNRSNTASEATKNHVLTFISDHTKGVAGIYEFMIRVQNVKDIIIKCLDLAERSGENFLSLTDGGFEVTGNEGYVAFKSDNNAVKFVDRLSFSRANFNTENKYTKGFETE